MESGQLRSQSEMQRKLPYLPDSGERHTVRLSRQRIERLFEARQDAAHQKLSRSVLFDDSGSDMFKVVSERKEVREQLQAMENRIRALQLAEAKAKLRLEKTKRMTDEKETLQKLKQREKDEHQHWLEAMEQQRLAEKQRIEQKRLEKKQKLQLAKELTINSKQVTTTKGKARALKVESHAKIEEMKSFLDRELERKERKRLELSVDYHRMHSNFQAEDREQRARVALLFQNKKQTEVRMKQEMEQRVRELEEQELRIIADLRQTCSSHQNEVQRLEKIITRSRNMTRSPPSTDSGVLYSDYN